MLLSRVAAAAALIAGLLAAHMLFQPRAALGSYEEPAQRLPLLMAAHRAQPRATSISVALGLELERAGDFAGAAAVFQHAARHDRQYLPAWTLANFYFRVNDTERFWRWSARAAAINPGDFRPLLQLAMHREPDPAALLAHLGQRPELLRAYLDLLIADHRWEATRTVAAAIRARNDPADRARLEALAQLGPHR